MSYEVEIHDHFHGLFRYNVVLFETTETRFRWPAKVDCRHTLRGARKAASTIVERHEKEQAKAFADAHRAKCYEVISHKEQK